MSIADVHTLSFTSNDIPPTEIHHNLSAATSVSENHIMQDSNGSADTKPQTDDEAMQDTIEDLYKQAEEILKKMFEHIQSELELTENQDEIEEDIFSNYMQYLREITSMDSINWNGLTYEFEAFQTITPEELSDGIAYLPSRYAAMADKLERNYTGEELTTQRNRLEQIYQAAKNGMIENYTKFLQDNLGISHHDILKIKDSFSMLLDEKVCLYRDTVRQVQENIAQTNENNIWLKNHDIYIAEQLRTVIADTISQAKSSAAYSVQDLTIAGQMAKKYQTEISSAVDSHKNETMFALALSMIDMETEIMIHEGKIGKNMADLLQSNRTSGHEAALSALNQRLANRKNNRASGESSEIFVHMDRTVFQGICDSIMKAYQKQ